ncbi:MAG: hypothetical protein ACXVP3_08995 [Actinomycetota bacterium]
MRLLFNAEVLVDAESLEDAWKLAKDVAVQASAVSDAASLLVKMQSVAVLDDEVVAVLDDEVERQRGRHGSLSRSRSSGRAAPAGERSSPDRLRATGRTPR